jgi:hypothetical protein
MAKVKEKAPSFASVIRSYYEENPEWLDTASNQDLIERYLKDHPGEEWSKRHQQGAANEKTKLRKKAGKVRRRRRKRSGGESENAANESRVIRVRTPMGVLEQLELLIDDCLSVAAKQNNPALENTVKHLRVARRSVAWAMGEPSSSRL